MRTVQQPDILRTRLAGQSFQAGTAGINQFRLYTKPYALLCLKFNKSYPGVQLSLFSGWLSTECN